MKKNSLNYPLQMDYLKKIVFAAGIYTKAGYVAISLKRKNPLNGFYEY